MNIVSSHGYGVIYVPSHPNYSNVVVEYNNINFSGIELSQNYYGTTKITALVQNKNVIGCQFHPEKSGMVGHKILLAFKEMVEC